MRFCYILSLLLLASCCRPLKARLEPFCRDQFASSKIGTPDPWARDHPKGQRLIITWDLPPIYTDSTPLLLQIRYLTSEPREHMEWVAVCGRHSFYDLIFPFSKPKVLSYAVALYDSEGHCIAEEEQKGWTPLLDL